MQILMKVTVDDVGQGVLKSVRRHLEAMQGQQCGVVLSHMYAARARPL